MSERLRVHPEHPAPRHVKAIAERLTAGALAILPSDAGYLLAWTLDARDAEDRAIRLRRLDNKHPFTLLCRHLSDVGRLARLDDAAFRLVKALTPGPRTFILLPGNELPKRLKQAKRRTLGCRIPEHPVLRAVLDAMGAPLVSTSLSVPEYDVPAHEADAVAEAFLRRVDCMLDAEDCPPGPTTVIDCSGSEPQVIRQGWTEVSLD
ncbi:MAG: threonylcarbamoyl-AMP synthase [Xanthomonadales bacterium]|nr:threonylcarbamoyl-AMP synthase [Xanthomonadales bacterium]